MIYSRRLQLKKLRLALAQINPVVGDLDGNARKIIAFIKKARGIKADLIAFPELSVTGYPPEDLLLKPHFIEDNIKTLNRVRAASKGITTIVGFVDSDKSALFNAAAIISNGRLIDVYHKKHLPNYGVFDEYRYFRPGKRYPVYELRGINIGVNICEDIWHEKGPAGVQAHAGAELIININASPYHMGKASFREQLVTTRASKNNVTIAYVNMVGGQDELIFDGGSFVLDSEGSPIIKGKQFKEEMVTVDLVIRVKRQKGRGVQKKGAEKIKLPAASVRGQKPAIRIKRSSVMSAPEEVYSALLLGTKDYARKNGFNGVVIGLSGGVDSALVAAIAVDALGKKNVHGLFMPSPYTSNESFEDVHKLAKNLGIKVTEVPISNIFKTYLKDLKKHFRKTRAGITEENLQARIRGNILMAFSNKFGWLVLTTGNKSEMSVGYATLYGDMAGGFAVIKDVPKTLVYDLCGWRNAKQAGEVIPDRVLWKEPTAELKPDQLDVDTLPPYQELDPILKAYIEEDKSFDQIMKLGCDV
ncbi:MAG TPA: NAD+ synthase, partial [Nitrospirae bacterium]|nr:NAD+ synthase [Nitrospirota bacterium]